MKTTIPGICINITDENFIAIQGHRGHYEVIVWANESDIEGDDGSNAIHRAQLMVMSDELRERADLDNTI